HARYSAFRKGGSPGGWRDKTSSVAVLAASLHSGPAANDRRRTLVAGNNSSALACQPSCISCGCSSFRPSADKTGCCRKPRIAGGESLGGPGRAAEGRYPRGTGVSKCGGGNGRQPQARALGACQDPPPAR